VTASAQKLFSFTSTRRPMRMSWKKLSSIMSEKNYSARNAIIGSMRVARREGT
jgi:hypothetical protein